MFFPSDSACDYTVKDKCLSKCLASGQMPIEGTECGECKCSDVCQVIKHFTGSFVADAMVEFIVKW